MTLEQMVAELGSDGRQLPREAMQWALDHWDEAGPRFVALLDAYAAGTDRSPETASALFFAVHLCGEAADSTAYRPLCRLLHVSDAAETVLGDAITETLTGILIRLYDGDPAPLKALVEDREADWFVSEGALQALVYLAHDQRFPESEMRVYLGHLKETLPPETDEMVWLAWVEAVSDLGYEDLAGEVEEVFRRDLVGSHLMSHADFEADLTKRLTEPDQLPPGFARSRIAPFTDAIGELEAWTGFTGEDDDDDLEFEDAPADMFQPAMPLSNPFRNVGRNDPCPCWSGTKFKKCCLPKSKLG